MSETVVRASFLPAALGWLRFRAAFVYRTRTVGHLPTYISTLSYGREDES